MLSLGLEVVQRGADLVEVAVDHAPEKGDRQRTGTGQVELDQKFFVIGQSEVVESGQGGRAEHLIDSRVTIEPTVEIVQQLGDCHEVQALCGPLRYLFEKRLGP